MPVLVHNKQNKTKQNNRLIRDLVVSAGPAVTGLCSRLDNFQRLEAVAGAGAFLKEFYQAWYPSHIRLVRGKMIVV